MRMKYEREVVLKEIKKKIMFSRIIASIAIIPFMLVFVFMSYFTWNKVPVWFTIVQFLVVMFLWYIFYRIFFLDKNDIQMIERQVKKEIQEKHVFEEFNNFLKSEKNREKLFKLKDFENFRKDLLMTKDERVKTGVVWIVLSSFFPLFLGLVGYQKSGEVSHFLIIIEIIFIILGVKVILSKNPSEKVIRYEYINTLKYEVKKGKNPNIDLF